MIDVWIYHENEVYEARPLTGVNFMPYEALNRLVKKDVVIDISKMMRRKLEHERANYSTAAPGQIVEAGYEWWDEEEYCYYSGITEVPILMVENQLSRSGVMSWYIHIDEAAFGITVSYGTNIVECAPNVSLDIYNGELHAISEKYIFGRARWTIPNSAHHVYIKAKFAHVHERKYWVVRSATGEILYYEPTDEQRMKDYIYSLQLDGNRIVGGVKEGLPSSSIMEWFYEGTEEEWLDTLHVKEKIYFEEIFDAYDEYNQDFEIGIPIGAMVAALPVSRNHTVH